MKNLQRDTNHYYEQYRQAGLSKKFYGLKLSELDKLEKLYKVNIQVYSLAPTKKQGEREEEISSPFFKHAVLEPVRKPLLLY